MADPLAQPRGRPVAALTGKPPRQAPPGSCDRCGSNLSRYRGKKHGGWETTCGPCQRAVFEQHVREERARRRNHRRRTPMTAQAPVKTVLQLPGRKWQREVQPGLEQLGFMFLGEDGGGHAIFQHRYAGQVRLAKTPGGSDAESKRQAFGRARRLLALQESEAHDFIVNLREMYGILPHETKRMRLNMMEEIQSWRKHAKPRMTADAIRSALRDSPFVEQIEHQRGARRADYLIHGADALTPDQLTPGVEIEKQEYDRRREAWLQRIAEQGGAVAWLANYLGDDARLVADIEEAANQAGLRWGTVTRVADELGIILEREPVYQGRVLWRLPAPPEIATYKPTTNGTPQPQSRTTPQAPPATTPQPPPAPQPAKAPPPQPKPEPPRQPTREPEPEPAQNTAPAAAPGDLLSQIQSLVERANRADDAEAQAAIAAEELRGVRTQLGALATATAALEARVLAALQLIGGG